MSQQPDQILSSTKWDELPLDGQFLLDSGLLFEINRSTFHPLGLSMAVKDGKIYLQDFRTKPDKTIYSAEKYKEGVNKLRNFLKRFGTRQMELRRKKLGFGFQPDPNKENK